MERTLTTLRTSWRGLTRTSPLSKSSGTRRTIGSDKVDLNIIKSIADDHDVFLDPLQQDTDAARGLDKLESCLKERKLR